MKDLKRDQMSDEMSDELLIKLLGFASWPRKGLGMVYHDVEAKITANIGEYRRDTGVVSTEQLARSFLWFALSETLFSNHASTAFFPLLESLVDLERVCDIAWGKAGLVELYFALDRFSRGTVNSLGCFDFAPEV